MRCFTFSECKQTFFLVHSENSDVNVSYRVVRTSKNIFNRNFANYVYILFIVWKLLHSLSFQCFQATDHEYKQTIIIAIQNFHEFT